MSAALQESNGKLHRSSPGIHPDHLRGALLRRLRDERPDDKLWEELQPAAFHVHHAIHQERAPPGWTQRAVQEEDHPHHHACLPLRQDSHQCHPERGGESTLWPWRPLSSDMLLVVCSGKHVPFFFSVSSLTWLPLRWPSRTCRRRLRSSPLPQTKTLQTPKCCRWCCKAV